MSDKPRGFILQPSRLGKPPSENEERGASAKPNFTGLKESKLGILAESKLTPLSGAIQAKPTNGAEKEDSLKPPPTFSFTPLTKPVVEESKTAESEKKLSDPVQPVKDDKDSQDNKFVFGQNLTERVENANEGNDGSSTAEDTNDENHHTSEKPDISGDEASKDSPQFKSETSNLLFSGVVSSSTTDENSATKTLSESAAEYTESHCNKRKYDVVDVVTGEEEESNVLQANVKMYLFDSEKKNWVERGRGVLRLNDDPVSTPGHLRSRLVMRTVGSLRVVLNTKLWPNMVCEKANEKSIRISAMEENEVKIFLISCSPKDADKLFTALEYRISQLKTDCNDENGPPPEKKVAKEN